MSHPSSSSIAACHCDARSGVTWVSPFGAEAIKCVPSPLKVVALVCRQQSDFWLNIPP